MDAQKLCFQIGTRAHFGPVRARAMPKGGFQCSWSKVGELQHPRKIREHGELCIKVFPVPAVTKNTSPPDSWPGLNVMVTFLMKTISL